MEETWRKEAASRFNSLFSISVLDCKVTMQDAELFKIFIKTIGITTWKTSEDVILQIATNNGIEEPWLSFMEKKFDLR